MSTADYVRAYESANHAANLSNKGFFGPLNTEPCTLYTGEDSHEIIEEDQPEPIEARELQGLELLQAYEQFEALAA